MFLKASYWILTSLISVLSEFSVYVTMRLVTAAVISNDSCYCTAELI